MSADLQSATNKVDLARRILALHEISTEFAGTLSGFLRHTDRAIVLPQSYRSEESGSIKNVVVQIDGTVGGVHTGIFSPNMFTGVSAIRVPVEQAEKLLKSDESRAKMLAALAEAVPSAVASPQLEIGPALNGDTNDRDTAGWIAGFDGPNCCVGLYSACESAAPSTGVEGMHRIYPAYYLVCKAGGGAATQAFHSRLMTELSKGASLDDCLLQAEGIPGPRALRRAQNAAARNRGRILALAASALGMHDVDTVTDSASPEAHAYRVVLPVVDVQVNTLRRQTQDRGRGMWYYAAGCIDSANTIGIIVPSNVGEGFIAFTDHNSNFKISVRNQTLNCIPFATKRLLTNRDAVIRAAEGHKQAKESAAVKDNATGHVDHAWIRSKFAWTDGESSDGRRLQLEPPCLWGAFASEDFIFTWARELGLSEFKQIRLRPEMVVVAGNERAKLRAARQYMKAKNTQ